MSAQELYDAIIQHVGTEHFANWYVGITHDIEERLFGYHNVNRHSDGWIHGQTHSSTAARSVETALLGDGFDGGDGGGSDAAVHVYAFRKDYGTVR